MGAAGEFFVLFTLLCLPLLNFLGLFLPEKDCVEAWLVMPELEGGFIWAAGLEYRP